MSKSLFSLSFTCLILLGFLLSLHRPFDVYAENFFPPPPQAKTVNHTGVAEGGPVTFNAFEQIGRNGPRRSEVLPYSLQPLWKFHPLNSGVHGASKSSPAVDDSGIYIGSDSGWFHAFNWDSSEKWSFYISDSNHGVHATAALDQENVYVGAYNGILYSLSKKDGTLRWMTALGDALGSSALLTENHLYIAVETYPPKNGFVTKLNRHDGSFIWNSDWLGDHSHFSPVYDEESDAVFVGSNTDEMVALDNQNGLVKWRFSTQGDIKATAVVSGEKLMFNSWDGFTYCLNKFTGQLLWKSQVGGKIFGTPVVFKEGSAVFVNNGEGKTWALSLAEGRILWSSEASASTKSTPLVSYDAQTQQSVIWTACGSQSFCALDANNGKRLAEYPIESTLSNLPAIHKDKIVLATDAPGPLLILKAKPLQENSTKVR